MTNQFAAALICLRVLAASCTGTDKNGAPGKGRAGDTATASDSGQPAGATAITGLSVRVHDDIGSLLTVSWDQDEAGTSAVVYMVDPGQWRSTPPLSRGAGHHEQLVLGVPFDHDVRLKLVLETSHDEQIESDLVEVRTDPLPDRMPEPHGVVVDKSGYDPDTPWLLGSVTSEGAGWGSNWWTFILDRKGRTVWAWESPDERVTMFARPSLDGRFILMDYDSYWWLFDEGAASEVARVDIEGRELQRWATPGLHHSFIELPEGGIAWMATGDSDETLRITDDDGNSDTLWSCVDTLTGPFSFSCISNTIFLDEPTDSYLVSIVSEDVVVRVDRATGRTLDVYGTRRSDWTVDPEDAGFSHQHDPQITGSGTLLLSTNGVRDQIDTAVREYELDADNHVLRQVWSFGDGEHIHADRLGTVQRLPGGNTQHGLGSAGRLREITPDLQVVWDMDWGEENELGRTTAIADIYDLLP